MALTDNISAYWKLDESSGNASDSVSSYTLTNNGTTPYASAKINNGIDFGTTNTTKWLSNANAIADTSTSNAYSVSFWVNIRTAPSSGQEQVLFDLQKAVGRQHQLRYINASGTLKIRFLNYDGSATDTFDTTKTLTAGTWYHFVVTKTVNSVAIYISNTSLSSHTLTKTGSSAGVNVTSFGRHGSASFGYATAYMDEIGIWSRVLTSDEITALYNSGSGSQYPFGSIFSISETLALTESTSNLRARLFSTSETLSLSETISTLKGLAFSVSESLGLVESYSYVWNRVFNVADSLGLVEVLAKVKKKWASITRSSSIWTASTKNSSTWTDSTKNSSTWNDTPKS